MDICIPNSSVINNTYRTAVLSNINEDGTFKQGTITNAEGISTSRYIKDTHGHHMIAMQMPHGDIEFWQQTDSIHNVGNDFRAMGFERRNIDGTVYLDTNRQPSVFIAFPGNTGTDKDNLTINELFSGEVMQERYMNVESFADDVVMGMQKRAELNNHDMPDVTVGTHSVGAMALGVAPYIKDKYGIENTKTFLVEPVGAGQTLEQLSALNAIKYYGEDPTLDQINIVANRLSENVVSIRADDDTIFSTLPIGDEQYDNAMVGETYRYTSEDSLKETIPWFRIDDHKLSSVGKALMMHGKNALVRTETNDLTGSQILEGGGLLGGFEKWFSEIKTMLFQAALPLLKLVFNQEASDLQQKDPSLEHQSFYNMRDDLMYDNSASSNLVEKREALTIKDTYTPNFAPLPV